MHIQKYKGLGEMNPRQLLETAIDAKSESFKTYVLRITKRLMRRMLYLWERR
ncbi:MAG: hypothetical protein QXQ64_10635 [Candidatus Bathyarchaeia archaeon]